METKIVTTDQSLTQINMPRPVGSNFHECVNNGDSPIATGSTSPSTPITAKGYTLTRMVQPTKEETMQAEREEYLRKLAEATRVDMAIDIPDEEPLLTIIDPITDKEVTLCGREDLVTIKASQKSGKSTLMAIFTAAMLCGQWGKVKSYIQGRRSILYIDTEMKPKDTLRMGRMALSLAGMDEKANPDGFYYQNMRSMGPDEIISLTEYLIRTLKPDVVFIDGSLDLCNNFNDPEESQRLVKGCYLPWIDTYHITLITAIHTNKTNDTHASQGHLGAMLDKKGEVTLECSRQKDSPFISVSAPTCRHAQIPTISFKHDENGMPVSCDQEVLIYKEMQAQKARQNKEEKDKKKLDDLKLLVTNLMADAGVAGISRKALIERLTPALKLGTSAIQERIKALIDNGFLTATGYNGNLVLASVEQQSE